MTPQQHLKTLQSMISTLLMSREHLADVVAAFTAAAPDRAGPWAASSDSAAEAMEQAVNAARDAAQQLHTTTPGSATAAPLATALQGAEPTSQAEHLARELDEIGKHPHADELRRLAEVVDDQTAMLGRMSAWQMQAGSQIAQAVADAHARRARRCGQGLAVNTGGEAHAPEQD